MGMLRFSFLLEICSPGSVPDAQLVAALLDLVNLIKYDLKRKIFNFKYN